MSDKNVADKFYRLDDNAQADKASEDSMSVASASAEVVEDTPVASDASADVMIFTDSAVSKVQELIAEEEDDLSLRVFITGGGCSGFQYGFTFEETINDEDEVVEKGGVKLLIDPMSLMYLRGAEIDYQEDLHGEQFIIRNPNASTTCGCGSSFAV